MIPRFTVTRELGRGGQGRVLAVRDAARGDRELALKETSGGEGGALRAEFELLARLRHPNLGAVHDWFARSPLAAAADEGASAPAPAAYTQDLIDGPDLYRALHQAPAEERERAFEQVLRALAYLHALGVVHLDLKPDNILVERSPAGGLVCRVLDFGIASPRGLRPDLVRGSLSYLAPERLRGAAVDPRADLYSLGVVMAEVWAGGPLPMGPALLAAATRRGWLAERGVPEAWLGLVVALTERDPSRRPATVYEAAALWSRALGRTISLQTPATVAAILRSAAPVGREATRDRCLAAVVGGEAQVIVGARGVGRRTLATQVVRLAASRGHAVECWPGTPQRRGVLDLASALERLLGADGGLVASALTATPEAGRGAGPGPGPGARVQQAIAQAVRPVVEELLETTATSPRPLLVVDQLASLPPPVEELLAQLVAESEGGRRLPFGLIVVAQSHQGAAAIGLPPLGREEVAHLLKLRLGPSLATPALASALTAASGGHPLTLENLLALLVARGELRFGPGGWTASSPDVARDLPDEMESAVRERVALLEPEARSLLSAVGWLRFGASAPALAAALDVDQVSEPRLAELEAAGLLWRADDGRWRCAHPQVAEAVREWSPPGGTAAAHARLRRLGGLAPLAAAWHLGGVAGASQALESARQAWAAWSMDAAASALDLALELDPELEAALALRADVADLLGPRELEVSCLQRLIALRAGAGADVLPARARLFWALTRTAQAEAAESLGRDVVAEAAAAGRQEIWLHAVVDLANVVIQRGDYAEGRTLLEAADAALDVQRQPGLAARVANNLGNIFAYGSELERALASYGRARDLKRREGDPVGQRIALGNMGLMCLHLGRSAEALEHFEGSLRAARELRHRRGEAWSRRGASSLWRCSGCRPVRPPTPGGGRSVRWRLPSSWGTGWSHATRAPRWRRSSSSSAARGRLSGWQRAGWPRRSRSTAASTRAAAAPSARGRGSTMTPFARSAARARSWTTRPSPMGPTARRRGRCSPSSRCGPGTSRRPHGRRTRPRDRPEPAPASACSWWRSGWRGCWPIVSVSARSRRSRPRCCASLIRPGRSRPTTTASIWRQRSTARPGRAGAPGRWLRGWRPSCGRLGSGRGSRPSWQDCWARRTPMTRLRWTPPSGKALQRMALSRMALSRMALSRMALSRMAPSWMAPSWVALS